MNDDRLFDSLNAEIERVHRLASERLELIQELEAEIVELKLDVARADEAAMDAGQRSAEETAVLLAARQPRQPLDLLLACGAYVRSLEAPDA